MSKGAGCRKIPVRKTGGRALDPLGSSDSTPDEHAPPSFPREEPPRKRMNADANESESRRIFTRAARCPVCDAPNGCRLETGEAYKGRCWCEHLTLPTGAVRRLQAELPDPRCLCRTCLESIAANPEITWEELARRRQDTTPPPISAGDCYMEGSAMIFTEQYHLNRGSCCESGCRHCPFDRQEGSPSRTSAS